MDRPAREQQVLVQRGLQLDPPEQVQEDADQNTESDDAHPEFILLRATAIATSLEVMFIGLATCIFFNHGSLVWRSMWICFSCVVLVRVAVLLKYLLLRFRGGDDEEDGNSSEDSSDMTKVDRAEGQSRHYLRILALAALAPFIFYLPLMYDTYVRQCQYKLDDKAIDFPEMLASVVKVPINATHLTFYTMRCEGILPGRMMFLVATASDLGLPILFFYVFVVLGNVLWQVDLLQPLQRHHLLISLVDFADVASIISMPTWGPSTFVFLVANTAVLPLSQVLYVLGFLSVLAHVLLISPLWPYLVNGRRLNAMSLFLIDVPFLCVRVYMAMAGCAIPYAMLAKNMICITNAISVILFNSRKFEFIADMLPGASKVEGLSSKRMIHQTKSDLEQQKIDAVVLRKQLKESQETRNRIELQLEQTRQLDVIREALDGGDVSEGRIREAFKFFSDNDEQKGALSGDELNHIFKMINNDKLPKAVKDLIKSSKDGVDVASFTNDFMDAINFRKQSEKTGNASGRK
jgi:hypothetical protein